MDTLILYLAAFFLLIFSLLTSREKTGLALKKALRALENILPQFLTVLVSARPFSVTA